MKELEAPKYNRCIGDLTILWFHKSNNYIILDKNLATLFAEFQKSKTKGEFINRLTKKLAIGKTLANSYYSEFKTLLEENNTNEGLNQNETNQFIPSEKLTLKEVYTTFNKSFQINFPSEKVKSLIAPIFNHLNDNSNLSEINSVYDIYHKNETLFLLENGKLMGQYPEREYYLLQGKLAMLITNLLHNKSEDDWIGTFHASTITDNKKGIMLVGNSGSGKSTFAALSMLYGYKLVSDDITPIGSKNLKAYNYPAAISIKEGSYNILKESFKDIEKLESYNLNPLKGNLRYLPSNRPFVPENTRCDTLLWINYSSNSETSLELISLDKILNMLIPDSWLHPNKENATRFLDWLKTLKCYKLTYSNNEDIKSVLEQVFT